MAIPILTNYCSLSTILNVWMTRNLQTVTVYSSPLNLFSVMNERTEEILYLLPGNLDKFRVKLITLFEGINSGC